MNLSPVHSSDGDTCVDTSIPKNDTQQVLRGGIRVDLSSDLHYFQYSEHWHDTAQSMMAASISVSSLKVVTDFISVETQDCQNILPEQEEEEEDVPRVAGDGDSMV